MSENRTIDAGLATLTISSHGDAVVASLVGELDISNVRLVQQAVSDAMHDPSRALVVDFTAVTYIDSSSVAMITSFASQLTMKRGSFAIVAPEGGQVRRVLHFSGVAPSLRIHEELGDAIGVTEPAAD